jgi:hypothetical protein
MKSTVRDLIDPSVFSCFSASYRSVFCNQLKWSTVSITTALLIVVSRRQATRSSRSHVVRFRLFIEIVYATSGLYTLIDVTTLISAHSSPLGNGLVSLTVHRHHLIVSCLDTSLSVAAIVAPTTIQLRWASLCVYFAIVLLITLLLCGIQWVSAVSV